MYTHTQIGWVPIVVLGVLSLFFLAFPAVLSPLPAYLSVMPLVLAALLFCCLTVRVGQGVIKLVFGIGLIHKRIKLIDIQSVSTIRTKWWCGYGIHGFWGKGWLFNVSGFDAISLRMKSGMVYVIGTDEPKQLLEAIRAALPKGAEQ